MANISMAKGTVGLSGKWTGRALDLLNILLENWSFEGAYGLTVFGKLSEKNRNVEFSGCGRWDFHGTLLSMHDWTVEHIEKRETKYGFDIAMYGELLKEMKRLGLAITFDFSDIPENDSEYHEIGYFISDGNRLVYKRGKPQEWRKGEKSFDSAVDFFSAMISEPAEGRKNTLEKAEYEKLLEIMKDRGLTIGLSFTDLLEEAEENYDWEKGRLVETGYLSSDGEKLVYITETRGIKEN